MAPRFLDLNSVFHCVRLVRLARRKSMPPSATVGPDVQASSFICPRQFTNVVQNDVQCGRPVLAWLKVLNNHSSGYWVAISAPRFKGPLWSWRQAKHSHRIEGSYLCGNQRTCRVNSRWSHRFRVCTRFDLNEKRNVTDDGEIGDVAVCIERLVLPVPAEGGEHECPPRLKPRTERRAEHLRLDAKLPLSWTSCHQKSKASSGTAAAAAAPTTLKGLPALLPSWNALYSLEGSRFVGFSPRYTMRTR